MTQSHRHNTRSGVNTGELLRCKEENPTIQEGGIAKKMTVGGLFKRAAKKSESPIPLKTRASRKQPDEHRRKATTPKEQKRETRAGSKRACEPALPVTQLSRENPLPKYPQRSTNAKTNILPVTKPPKKILPPKGLSGHTHAKHNVLPDTSNENTSSLPTLLDKADKTVLTFNKIQRPDGEPHLLEFSYKSTKFPIQEAISVEVLEFPFITFFREEFFTSNNPKVLFSASVHKYGLELLLLESSQNDHATVCDLLFIDSHGTPLKRFFIAEDNIIAFHAESVTLPAIKFLGSPHKNSLHKGIRVAFSTTKQVYILDFNENEIREIRALSDPQSISASVPLKLEGYYACGHAMDQQFETSIQKNGIRFLTQAQSLMVIMTDGSVFVFRVDSITFYPVYFTNLFQREHIELLQIARKRKPNSHVDVEEFVLLEKTISELEIDSCSVPLKGTSDFGLIDAYPAVDAASTTFSITAGHQVLVLTLGIYGDVLVDHYEATRKLAQKVIPILFPTGQIYILHLNGTNLKILVQRDDALEEQFSCELSKNKHDLTQKDQTLNLTSWAIVGRERTIGFLSKEDTPLHFRFSSGLLAAEENQGIFHVCEVAPSSTLSIQQAKEIIDTSLQTKYPYIKRTDGMQEAIIRTVLTDTDSAYCILRIRGF